MTFHISSKLSLPDDAALWTFADLAIKGAGKTYAASVLAEEMVKHGIPIIALDGIGSWWGLRVGVDGKAGLPVVVFGGSHKDISIPVKSEKGRPLIDEERLKLMVKAILQAKMSAVLDTSEFSKGMQRRIVAIFVNELYHLNAAYGVRHIFIEEADLWCPQRIVGDVAASAGAIDDLVRRGGNFNLGCTLITQRSAVLNKDVLTQANCLIVLRILHKLDKKAVQTWVESMANPDDSRIKKWYDSLKDLKNGEAWFWHPQEPEIFEKIQFRKRETLHATREYFRQAKFEQKDIRMMDVEGFIQKFKNIFEPPVVVKPVGVGEFGKGTIASHTIFTSKHNEALKGETPSLEREPTPTPHPEAVNQSLPSLEIRQSRPTLNMSVESLDAPTNPIGRVAVVLKNDAIAGGRQDKWTIKRIKEHIKRHEWPEDEVEEAVAQLIRWEILVKQADNYIRFNKDRVQIVDSKAEIPA